MKAPARQFQLSDWYGADWDHKKPADDLWVSPWAKAHYKLRQQEIEIEKCMFMLQQAVDEGNFDEAEGLRERADRMRSQHPIIPREERLAQALEDENYALAAIFQKDLNSVKENLGLPKFDVGQAVTHSFRDGLRGVVIDVDLQCTKGAPWIESAGCLERGCALGYPGEETEFKELLRWARQPFYTVLLDLSGTEDFPAPSENKWRWPWPSELSAWQVNNYDKLPAPLYLSEDSLSYDANDKGAPSHPELEKLFGSHESYPHRGRVYQPSPRLRLWQQERAKEQQATRQKRAKTAVGSKNPYDAMQ